MTSIERRRQSLWQRWTGVVVLTGLLCGLLAVWVLAVHTQRAFDNVSRYQYDQCVQRQSYDASSQQARTAFRAYYRDYVVTELHNKFIDDRLRAQRIAEAKALISALDDTLRRGVTGSCAKYRP